MHTAQRFLKITIPLIILFLPGTSVASPDLDKPLVTEKVVSVLARVAPILEKELSVKGFKLGAPVFIRIFKVPGELEVWMDKNGHYELFKSYSICDFSGYPGPKLHEGDWQSPEGFYSVAPDQMNPRSNYHLSFNIGYPNEYDRLLHRSGGDIMVHGNCSSMGCFAMSDYRMEEIYTLTHSALTNGQKAFSVHVFPFRLTDENIKKFRYSPWITFWKNLKEGFDVFELTGQVPDIRVVNRRYIVSGPARIAMHRTRQ